VSFPTDTPEASNICPHLGLADDADSHATYATEAHRCFRLATPTRIATGHQDGYCLGENHPQCPVFMGEGVEATATPAAAAPPPLESAPPEPQAPIWSSNSDTATQTGGGVPPPAGRKPGGSVGGGGLSMPAATISLFALAIVVVIVAYFINQQLGDDGGSGSPAETLAVQQTQTAEAGGPAATQSGDTDPTATTQGGGTGTGTPATTAEPTEDPAETPTEQIGQITHTVEAGQYLGTIAALYGTTVDAILAANPDISDPNSISVGQVLIIPQ